MTWEMIAFIIFIIAAAVFFIANRAMPKVNAYGKANDGRVVARIGALVSVSIAVLVLLIGSYTVVSTRNVGVITTFGKPSGTIGNGFHLKAPWQSVTEMDGAIQIDWHKDADPNGDNHGDALVVRLANNSNAWTDTSVRWEIKMDAADDLFLQYYNQHIETTRAMVAFLDAYEGDTITAAQLKVVGFDDLAALYRQAVGS